MKALRRQVGADTIELDTEKSFARYTLARPRRIDFAKMEEAAEDASYTLKSIVLEIEGVTSETQCQKCGRSVPTLRIPATGQTFELEGDVPIGVTTKIRASVQGWDGGHARLVVLEFETSE